MANTTPDPKRLLDAINNATAVYRGKELDIDSADAEPVANDDGSFSLEMTKYVDEPKPASHRGPGGGKPVGIIRYTVTVSGKFEAFDVE